MAQDDADRLRGELREIGDRRSQLTIELEVLARDTTQAVARAKGRLSISEVARLVGVDRTGIYRTYHG